MDKLLRKIKNNPKHVKFDDLKKLLLKNGYEIRQPRGGSSHYFFAKKGKPAISVPKKRPFVREYYVKQVLKLLEED